MNELVTITNNVPLADSRVVADELGVQHGPFMTNIILKYQYDVEVECGVVHFKNGKPAEGSSGGRPERYALLTEVQTNSYLSLARNTPKSIPLKIKLAKAFDEAKHIIAQLLKAKPQFRHKYTERLIINSEHRVYGYIPAVKFLDDINIQFVEDVIILSETSSPDISIGQFLAKRLPRETWYDLAKVRKPVGGPDRRKWDQDIVMVVYVTDQGYHIKREVTHFPIEWYPAIWHIVQTEYFPDLFPKYLAGKHNGIIRCADEEARKYIIQRVNHFIDRQ